MKKILANRITIVTEIIVLILGGIWLVRTYRERNEVEIEPIIVCIGSLSFLVVSIIKLYDKEDDPNSLLGEQNGKYLDKSFLDKYLPGEITIEKVIENLGQPNSKVSDDLKYEHSQKAFNYTIYRYRFSNAIVLFTTENDDPNILSISLVAKDFKSHPIYCRYSFAEEDLLFGKAQVTQNIIDNAYSFKNENYASWCFSSITCRYVDYRPIKHLYFTYFIYNQFERKEDTLNSKIDGICISNIEDLKPIIHFDDFMFY